MKEKICYLTSNPQRYFLLLQITKVCTEVFSIFFCRVYDELSAGGTGEIEKTTYTLPDGSHVEITPGPRVRAPEILFKPDLIGCEFEGVHEVLVYSITKSDLDLRKVFYQNIVLSGGSTLFKGKLIVAF